MHLSARISEKAIDDGLKDFDQCHFPGLSVGIALSGVPSYRKSFGVANIDLPVLLTPATRMRIGSITKHFTALAYLLLCEDCLAKLDDPIGKYIPELSPSSRTVTVRQLMGHVSGLRDIYDISYTLSGFGHRVSCADLLKLYKSVDDANTQPGATWSYNNGGYLLLSIAIERITNMWLGDFMRARLFEPVGMRDTMIRRWDSDFIPGTAALHMRCADGFTKLSLGTEYDGVGGIVSTIDDMLRWLSHMTRPIVGREATWKAMQGAQELANGTSTNYGLGLVIANHRGLPLIAHGGSVLSGTAHIIKVPSLDLDIVVITNRSDLSASDVAYRLLEECVPGLSSTSSASDRAPAFGTFHSAKSGPVVQLYGRDGSQFATVNGAEFPFEAAVDGSLVPTGPARDIRWTIRLRGASDRPSSIVFEDYGTALELPAIFPACVSDFAKALGTYASTSTETTASIIGTKHDARLRTYGKFGTVEYELAPLGNGLFRAQGPHSLAAALWFPNDSPDFYFDTCRTRRLRFARQAP